MKYILFLVSALSLAAVASAQVPVELTLEKCRSMAVEASEDLKVAENALHQAELTKKIATSAFLPKIEGSATGAYVYPNQQVMGMELVMKGVYMAGITLTQPLFAGGKIVAGNTLARIGIEASQEQLRLKRMEVVQEADQTFWSYVAVREKVRMLDCYRARMDTLYMQTEAASAVGLATHADLMRVETHRSNIAYQQQRARNGADLCRMALCRIIGVDFATPISIPESEVAVAEMPDLDTDISARPEMHLLSKQVEAGKYQERMARADMLPMLGASVGAFYYDNISMNGTQMLPDGTLYPITMYMGQGVGLAMLALKVPIFHWGEASNKLKKVKYDTASARFDLQKNEKMMNLEVRQAVNNLQEGLLLVTAAEKAAAEAEESLRITREKHSASMATLTDLLASQADWQQASSNLIEAKTQYMIYRTAYLKAVGKL